MKKISTFKSSAGFSLVELMVVVAIIGVLAAMSVGQVQKQIAKARQSEAKTNLASIFSAEKNFTNEWATYTGDFGMLALGFNGDLRYNSGFAGVGPGAPVGYQGPNPSGFANTGTFCPGAGGCRMVPSNGVNPTGLTPGATPTAIIFTASASAAIYNATTDTWTMDNNKSLVNTAKGIP